MDPILTSIRSSVAFVIEVAVLENTPEVRQRILYNIRKSILEDKRIEDGPVKRAYIQTIDDEITSL